MSRFVKPPSNEGLKTEIAGKTGRLEGKRAFQEFRGSLRWRGLYFSVRRQAVQQAPNSRFHAPGTFMLARVIKRTPTRTGMVVIYLSIHNSRWSPKQ